MNPHFFTAPLFLKFESKKMKLLFMQILIRFLIFRKYRIF